MTRGRLGWRASSLLLLACLALLLPACGGGGGYGYYEVGVGYDVIYVDDPLYYDEPYWDDPCGCYYYKTAAVDAAESW